MLRRRLNKNTESSIRLKEEMDVEMQMRENELLQKCVDEKIRLLDERERQEHEEKFRKKQRE